MEIWAACMDAATTQTLTGQLIRIVENQEQIATNTLVDNLDEQFLLEELLETSKPEPPPATAHLHYLLSTPFRYPPLRHGSRFSTRYEPSLFYGSAHLHTVLAEAAYYRFIFWYGMAIPPPNEKLTSEHTIFAAEYAVDRGLCLHKKPFTKFTQQISSPKDYVSSQALGQQMREAGIQAFAYFSARDPKQGINIGLFSPQSFTNPNPLWQQQWLCEVRQVQVSFYNKQAGTFNFALDQFAIEGELPTPSV